MEANFSQILSLIVIGILLGELLFQVILAFLAERKNLHIMFSVAFASLIFVIGFNKEFGMLHELWPGYNYELMKNYLFCAINAHVACLNFIFAVMPRFRRVDRRLMYTFVGAIAVVCLFFIIGGDDYYDIVIAVDAGVHLAYLIYVYVHLIKIVNLKVVGSLVYPILFTVYIIYIVTAAVCALHNRDHIWWHLMYSSFFSVLLSFVGAIRKYNSMAKTRVLQSTFSPDITQRMEELENSNSSKDKFFSIVAHDLKNPISSIKTLSEIYMEDASQSNDPHSKELAHALCESIESLCNLLEDLLTWSRTQLGAIQCVPMYIDIGTLIDDTKRIIKPMCDAKNIELRTSINGRDKILADRNMMETILRNLLTNAVKFSYQDSSIMLDFDVEGFDSIIKVTDNGIGMSQDAMHRLFQIDKVESRPGTRQEHGTGLGLILCSEFVKKHHGTIEVETEEGLGTSIIIKLPYMREFKPEAHV